MFKLPGLPSPQAPTRELADFAELLCWKKGGVSEREIAAYLGRVDDNDMNSGCDDNDDKNENVLDEVMNEIDRRITACGNGYPFQLERKGTVLRFEKEAQNSTRSIIYLYLLLGTRLDMDKSKIHVDIDGTGLLESLSAHVLKNYLGPNRAKSFIFGTSQAGSFESKVNNLCHELCEGSRFRSLDNTTPKAKDDKLDTVAWIPFLDRLPGQLMVFAQCKTGTNWRDSTAQLHPLNFNKKWMSEAFLVDPLRAYCVAESVDRTGWKSTNVETGILFDRCRLVDFCDGIEKSIESDIRKWTLAAKKTIPL